MGPSGGDLRTTNEPQEYPGFARLLPLVPRWTVARCPEVKGAVSQGNLGILLKVEIKKKGAALLENIHREEESSITWEEVNG
jgi:hypothetical protein